MPKTKIESTYSVALVILAGAADAAKLAADGRGEAPYLLRRAAGRGAALAVGPVNHVALHAGAGSERERRDGIGPLSGEEGRREEKRGGGWERTGREREKMGEGGRAREKAKRGGDGDGNGGDNGGDARRTANKMAASSLSVHGSVGASIRRQHDSASDEQSRIRMAQNEMRLRCRAVSCRPGSFVGMGCSKFGGGFSVVGSETWGIWGRKAGCRRLFALETLKLEVQS